MLLSKIEKIEILAIGHFVTDLKVTACNGEVDVLLVDASVAVINNVTVSLKDRNINSYKLVGVTLTNKVEKTTGALAGAIFSLSNFDASIVSDEKECCDVYISGEDHTYTITIGSFKVKVQLYDDLQDKPTFEILKCLE